MQATQQRKNIIRIGTSTINPATELNWLWNKLLADLPDYQIIFVPLETYDLLYPNFYDYLGEDIDLVLIPLVFPLPVKRQLLLNYGKSNLRLRLGLMIH